MNLATLVRRGWPVVLEMVATMPGRPDVVWELITDWEHQGDWMLEASDFVVTSEQREGVGVTAESTVSIAGITTRDKVRITVWEPPRHLAMRHSGWVSGEGHMYLTPLDHARSHFFWREELYPPVGAFGAMGLTAFKPMMGRMFRRDLRILTSLVRARSATGESLKDA